MFQRREKGNERGEERKRKGINDGSRKNLCWSFVTHDCTPFETGIEVFDARRQMVEKIYMSKIGKV